MIFNKDRLEKIELMVLFVFLFKYYIIVKKENLILFYSTLFLFCTYTLVFFLTSDIDEFFYCFTDVLRIRSHFVDEQRTSHVVLIYEFPVH